MNETHLIIATFLFFIPFTVQGTEMPSKKEGVSPVVQSEIAMTRQKNLLSRLIEDLDKLTDYMEEDLGNLDSRMASVTLLEPESRDDDLASIKEGYESHLKWLYKMKEAFEEDYNSYFRDGKKRRDWIAGTAKMVKGYENFRAKAARALSHYVEKKEKLVYYLNRQRFLMTETESLRNEIAALENTKSSDENYIKSLKDKLWAYQVEMNAIAPYKEEMYLHYLLLMDQLREKNAWLNLKVEEYKAIEGLAKALGSGTGKGESVRLQYKALIAAYEKGLILLGKKVDLMGRKDWSITPYGDIREVERFNELTDYYELMKSRYDDYKRFLGIQADGFRADMDMREREN